MTFEQPATLNKYVAEPLPVNWASRWKCIQLPLPLLAFMTICLAERFGVMMWTHDRFNPRMLLLAFLPTTFLLAVALILIEVKLRSQGGIRRLRILDTGISFWDTKRPAIRWSKVVAFWLEEIPNEQELKKITVEYFGNKKTKYPRRYSLALTKRDQCPALLSELNLLRQQHSLEFRVNQDASLPPLPAPRNPVLSLSLSFAGLLFLLHGMALLLAPLTHDNDASHHSDPNHEWSPGAKTTFAWFIKAHFSSVKEFQHCWIATGAVLTLIGIGLMVAGHLVGRQKSEETSPAQHPWPRT